MTAFAATNLTPVVVVHGGAGRFAPHRLAPAEKGCRNAAEIGLRAVGGGALEAVVAAVRALEDDPLFNAGTGSVLCRDGSLEMDASVMDGRDLSAGAVAAVPNAKNAILLARALLERGEHVMLAGDAVWNTLADSGFAPVARDSLVTARALERLEQAARDPAMRDPGTVGAVAVDAHGNVAAATSTGGMSYKRPGRVGDTPLLGCGTIADNRSCAASATGQGEAIMRVTMAASCADVAAREGAQAAAESAVHKLADRVGGTGGIICVRPDGTVGIAHNTGNMPFAIARPSGDGARIKSGVRW